jgi:predicted nuclease with TOPRIM domain
MILINDNWETVDDLQDVSDIIREYYNRNLADELDKLIPERTDEEYYELDEDMSCEIAILKNECCFLECENKQLENRIDELENKLEELKD